MGQCFEKCLRPGDDEPREVDTAVVLAVAMRNAGGQGAGNGKRSDCHRSSKTSRASLAVSKTGQREHAGGTADSPRDTEVVSQQAEEVESHPAPADSSTVSEPGQQEHAGETADAQRHTEVVAQQAEEAEPRPASAGSSAVSEPGQREHAGETADAPRDAEAVAQQAKEVEPHPTPAGSSAVLATGQQEHAGETAGAPRGAEVVARQAKEVEQPDGVVEAEASVGETRAATYTQLLVSSEGGLESSTFIPKALRAVGDSATRRWGKEDLFERDGCGIGNGAFASVVAVKTFAGSVIAAKKMERNHPTKGNQDDLITRELGLLTECAGHPHVVEAFGHMMTAEMVYMLMPLAETDVLKLIQIEPLGQTEAVHIARQMLSALAFLHGKSIIHFDVKPANLLLTGGAERRVLLADFGASQRVGDDEVTTVMGTLPYLAPEVLSEDDELDTKVDIWAAGVVVYEMLHGFTPFSWQATQRGSGGVKGGGFGGRGKQDGGVVDNDTDDTEDASRKTGEVLTDEDDDNAEKARISTGHYQVDSARVDTICATFIATLLQVSPDIRVTAAKAAQDHWLGGPSMAAETQERVSLSIAKYRESKVEEKKEQMASFGRRRRVVRRVAVKVP